MNEADLGSTEVLWQARLQSDRIRIISMLTILGLLLLSTVLRGLILAHGTEKAALPLLIIYFGVMIGFEFLMLRRVGSALRSKADLSQVRLTLNVFVETLFHR